MFESFLRYIIIIIYSARFLGRFGFRDVICYFRLLPLSVSKGRPKGKMTPRLVVKKENQKSSPKEIHFL